MSVLCSKKKSTQPGHPSGIGKSITGLLGCVKVRRGQLRDPTWQVTLRQSASQLVVGGW